MLVSYHYFKKGLPKELNGVRVLLDSGAFSAAVHGGKVSIEEYADFVKSHKSLVEEFMPIDVPSSPKKTDENFEALVKLGVAPIYVDHIPTKITDRAKQYYRTGKKVAWGGMVNSFWLSRKDKEEKKDGKGGSSEGGKGKGSYRSATNTQLIEVCRKRTDLCKTHNHTYLHLLGVGRRSWRYAEFWKHVDSFDFTSWAFGPAYGRVEVLTTRKNGWPGVSGFAKDKVPKEIRDSAQAKGFDFLKREDRLRFSIRTYKRFFQKLNSHINKSLEKGEILPMQKAMLGYDEMFDTMDREVVELAKSYTSPLLVYVGPETEHIRKAIEEDRDRATKQAPQNSRGWEADETIRRVEENGRKFNQDEADYVPELGQSADRERVCGNCRFYLRAETGSVGECQVVDGPINWFGTSDLFIDAGAEARHSLRESDERRRRAALEFETTPDHARKIIDGDVSMFLEAKKHSIEGPVLVTDGSTDYGIIEVEAAEKISTWKFAETVTEHGLTDEEREKRWPKSKVLWGYRVSKVEKFKDPEPEAIELNDDEVESLKSAQSLAHQLAVLAPSFCKRSVSLLSGMQGKQPIVSFLDSFPRRAEALKKDLSAVNTGKLTKCGEHNLLQVVKDLHGHLSKLPQDAIKSLGKGVTNGLGALSEVMRLASDEFGRSHHSKNSREHSGEIQLDQVTTQLRPVLLERDAVSVVGGLANWGVTKGDIDLLLSGPSLSPHIESLVPEGMFGRTAAAEGGDIGGPENRVGLYDLWLVPKSHEVRPGDGEFRILQASDAEVHGQQCIDTVTKAEALCLVPKSRGKRQAVYQYHFIGKGMHGDLRLQLDDVTVGWTIDNHQPGRVPTVKDVREARRFARRFQKSGSYFERDWNEGVAATPKGQSPMAWLNLDHEKVQPGEVGATAEEPAVLSRVTDPDLKVEYGLQTPSAHEYFFTGDPEFQGRLLFSLQKTEKPRWWSQWQTDLRPLVLTERAAKARVMPPDGYSGIPVSLERLVPSSLRYWEARGEEARAMRDELVKRGHFTDSNVKVVNGDFQRVLHKIYLDTGTQKDKETSKPYGIAWQQWKSAEGDSPTRERWHLVIGKQAWALDRDPLQGHERIAGDCRTLKSTKLMKFEGQAKPAEQIGGEILNATKSMESWVRNVDSGFVEFLSKSEDEIRLRFRGKMRGIYTLKAEEPGSRHWVLVAEESQEISKSSRGASAQVFLRRGEDLSHVECPPCGSLNVRKTGKSHMDGGRSLSVVECNDCAASFAPGHINEVQNRGELSKRFAEYELAKAELEPVESYSVIKQVPVRQGLQVWANSTDPSLDRRQLRPFALYEPMMGSEYASGEELLQKVATSTTLQGGMLVEPRLDGLEVSVQKRAERVRIFMKQSTTLQTLILDKKRFKSEADARRWLKEHEFTSGKVDETEDSYRFRQREPGEFKEGSFRTITLTAGVKGVIGILKRQTEKREELRCDIENEVRKLGGDFVLDGFITSGDRATTYLGIHDALFLPSAGNVTAKRYIERRRKVEHLLQKSEQVYLTPSQLVRTDIELQEALVWANESPESNGAIIKAADASYTFGGNELCAVFKGNAQTEDQKAFDEVLQKKLPLLKTEKSTDDERFVLGVVLEPNDGTEGAPLDPDTQKDIYSAEDIRESAHKFMEKFRNIGLMHKGVINSKVKILESYVAPVEMNVNGTKVRKGTWLLAVRVLDDALWRAIKRGDLTGFSIGGSALRKPVKEAA